VRRAGLAAALLLLLAPWIWVGSRSHDDHGDADVAVLTENGSAVGPLEALRVPGKYTVFDVYADWCLPCQDVDRRLREIAAERPDVAVRKLNVVDFESPLAAELGPQFDALPYLVVFSPAGGRTVVVGLDPPALDRALGGGSP
jgi:thiol-disulfide isomerase/thioredoxin